MKNLQLLGVVLAAVALSTCASSAPVRSSPDNGAIYGYFDIPKDDFGDLSDVHLLRYPYVIPVFGDDVALQYVVADGAFFAYDVAPGQYFLQSFSAVKPIAQSMVFQLVMLTADDKYNDRQIRDLGVITMKPAGLVYLGAQKVSIKSQPGLFRKGKINMGPADSPTEKEVLEKLLPALQGTPWEAVIKERIAALK